MEKYGLGLLHFNIQFIAGELETYHREVRETFSPVLDLLVNHPTWKFDIELQGHMVEFLAKHYPYTLEKLRKLVDNGQVELISCHYSDQIWIAFPKVDMIKSIQINDRVLKEHGLKRSRVFFAQENFFGEGLTELSDYFDICVARSSYYTYFHPIDELKPYYKMGNLKVLIAPDLGITENIQWSWFQCADGEPVNVSGMPNHTRDFYFNKRKMGDFEQKVEGLEKSGYEITSVSDFVSKIDHMGFKAEELEPILDGAWQMHRCGGAFQWMGRYVNDYEEDWVVRSHNFRTRSRLLAAETLLTYAKNKGVETKEQYQLLEKAWRHQLLAEVSDSTGWIPTSKEVHYAVEESDEVLNIVQNIIDYVKCKLGLGLVEVDTETGEVSKFQGKNLAGERYVDINDQDSLVGLFGAKGTIRQFQKKANQVRLCVEFVPTERISGVFKRYDVDYLQYSPALMESKLVKYNLDCFRANRLYLPLPNGLITLRENFHIIKHNEDTHIACLVDKNEQMVKFQMENAPRKDYHWVFTLFWGTAKEALRLANKINVRPKVVV
jgi:hypothetical protein